MATRCKMICLSVTKNAKWGKKDEFYYSTKFTAVTSDSPENKGFFDATPSGTIELSTVREDHFIPGKEYYVDFTEA